MADVMGFDYGPQAQAKIFNTSAYKNDPLYAIWDTLNAAGKNGLPSTFAAFKSQNEANPGLYNKTWFQAYDKLMNPAQPQAEQAQQPSADPFLEFLMGQLGIAGFGQQQQPQSRGRNDWWGQGQQTSPAPAPADPYQQLLGQLGGIDPLLGALLGGFQPQPQPQQQGNLLSQILGGY